MHMEGAAPSAPLFLLEGLSDLNRVFGKHFSDPALAGGAVLPYHRAQGGGCGTPLSTRAAQAWSSSHSFVRSSR